MVPALQRAGLGVIYASRYAGVVVARGGAVAVRAAAGDPAVLGIYQARTNQLRLDVSRVVVQADIVNARGIDSDGVRVGIVEDGRIATIRRCPAPTASCAPPSSRARPRSTKPPSPASSRARALSKRHGAEGHADRRQCRRLQRCRGDGGDRLRVRQGAAAVNMSFGTETDGAYTGLPAMSTGSSTTPASASWSPSRTTARSDGLARDRLQRHLGGRLLRPQHDGAGATTAIRATAIFDEVQRLPRSAVAGRRSGAAGPRAPGGLIQTINLFGGALRRIAARASPHPMSSARWRFCMTAPAGPCHQAERVRAIIMASARHNIDGAPGSATRTVRVRCASPPPTPCCATVSPGGSPPAAVAAASRTCRRSRPTAGQRGAGGARLGAQAGLRQPHGEHRPNLQVRTRPAAWWPSASCDNNFEIVEFVAAVTGTYRIRVDDRRSSAGAEIWASR